MDLQEKWYTFNIRINLKKIIQAFTGSAISSEKALKFGLVNEVL